MGSWGSSKASQAYNVFPFSWGFVVLVFVAGEDVLFIFLILIINVHSKLQYFQQSEATSDTNMPFVH